MLLDALNLTLEASPSTTPLVQLSDPLFASKQVEVFVKREDLLDPNISGNKWYKLKHNLNAAVAQGHDTLMSFGGAHSNHLHALAYSARHFGLKSIGIVRGEQGDTLTPTLLDCAEQGMSLQFVSRSDYRKRHDIYFLKQLLSDFGPAYFIPEGGSNLLGAQGCADIVEGISLQLPSYDFLFCAVGTGTTLAGLAMASPTHTHVIGVSCLKGAAINEGIKTTVQSLLTEANRDDASGFADWELWEGYHGGGFGKASSQLQDFIQDFQAKHGIPLEPLYTGKLFYALQEEIARNFFKPGSRIVVIHSGGLQGLRGM